MFYNRDEFMLLSRGGRVPRAAPRAGPSDPRHELPPAEPWRVQLAVAAVAGRLRRHRAPGAQLDRDAYRELEFAVDDDPRP